jgi:outer membrane protein OmpA-like peptidoglycan-associated protein
LNHSKAASTTGILGVLLALSLTFDLPAQEETYLHVVDDLGRGMELQDIAGRAYDNADDYWAGRATGRDGDDYELSAGEAVTEIYTAAASVTGADPYSRDIVKVTTAVVDAWPDCQDTFDAVRAAVDLEPQFADEIIATVAVKRDCNCNNGGLWLDQRVHDRIRVEMRHDVIDVPFQCSCSQIAMYAGIAGLHENREFNENLPEEEKAALIASMVERVTVITERTAALQSFNSWECGCTDVNIAASMQGIEHDELRDGAYDGLGEKYAEEAGDTGLVVDSIGIVGTYPEEYWGDDQHITQSNVLRRKGEVYRGDNLLLAPFHPVTEYTAHGDRNLQHLGQHQHTSDNMPTDLIISEYVEGWNEVALQSPESERDPGQRNRVLELYNGSEETIDLGSSQYFVEIYSGPGDATDTIVTPPLLVKKTISLESDVTFEFDQAEVRAEASDDLTKVAEALNEADLFSEIVIVGHTCDLGPAEYNLQLSERRADSVRDYLRQAGLKDVEIRTEGHGEREPRLPNSSDANRSRNRSFVTKEGEEIETTVSEGDPGAPKKYEYTFLLPIPPTVHEVESEPAGTMAAGEYSKGDDNPRQVIGLNGAIEPGQTFIVAYSESDDAIKEMADEVTSQLDFRPNETLVLRRLGGEMALNCKAQSYAFVTSYPPLPLIRYPNPDPGPYPPDEDDVASPN